MAGTTGTHDVGGMLDDAAIDVASGSKKYKLWELQTHWLVTLLSKKGLLTVDEVRIKMTHMALRNKKESLCFSQRSWLLCCR